jgi:hypothetical protein
VTFTWLRARTAGGSRWRPTVVRPPYMAPKAEAREAAREVARRTKRELFVHGRDGRIRERDAYGTGPRSSKG